MAPKKEEEAAAAAKPAEVALDIKILKTDMSEDMAADIETATKEVFGKHKLHKDLATAIKAQFDEKHPPADNKATSGVWHCIVGSDFACSVVRGRAIREPHSETRRQQQHSRTAEALSSLSRALVRISSSLC